MTPWGFLLSMDIPPSMDGGILSMDGRHPWNATDAGPMSGKVNFDLQAGQPTPISVAACLHM